MKGGAIETREIRLSLEYGLNAVYQVVNGVCDETLPEELASNETLLKQIDQLTEAYHACFVNTEKEFRYAPEEAPQAVKVIRDLYPEVEQSLRQLVRKPYLLTLRDLDL